MKLICVALLATALYAADKPVIIQWDAANLRLSWKSLKDGKTKMTIDFLKQTMTAGKKQYPLSKAETEEMAPALIHMITEYAIVSEDWANRGGQYLQKSKKEESAEIAALSH